MAPIAINNLTSNGHSASGTFPAGYAAPRELLTCINRGEC